MSSYVNTIPWTQFLYQDEEGAILDSHSQCFFSLKLSQHCAKLLHICHLILTQATTLPVLVISILQTWKLRPEVLWLAKDHMTVKFSPSLLHPGLLSQSPVSPDYSCSSVLL